MIYMKKLFIDVDISFFSFVKMEYFLRNVDLMCHNIADFFCFDCLLYQEYDLQKVMVDKGVEFSIFSAFGLKFVHHQK